MEDKLPKRKQMRLKDYDYSQNGCYFVTICINNRREVLPRIVGDDDLGVPKQIELKPYGKAVEKYIISIGTAYQNVTVENYVVMPNHIHILIMIDNYGTPRSSSPTLGNIISAFKKYTNSECGISIWQRSYYDHIIRNQKEYEGAWEYIEYNALKEYK